MLQTAVKLHHSPVRCGQAPPPTVMTGKRDVVQVLYVDTEGVEESRLTVHTHTHTNKNNSKRDEAAASSCLMPLFGGQKACFSFPLSLI